MYPFTSSYLSDKIKTVRWRNAWLVKFMIHFGRKCQPILFYAIKPLKSIILSWPAYFWLWLVGSNKLINVLMKTWCYRGKGGLFNKRKIEQAVFLKYKYENNAALKRYSRRHTSGSSRGLLMLR